MLLRSLRLCHLAILLSGLFVHAQGAKESMEMSAVQKRRVLEACFEVVVPKPKADPLAYEKPLPWDKVPFSIRSDDYHSIGTAFAISDRELVTAFHVLELHQRSVTYPRFFVRDREQRVFEVDQILACDQDRDYVRFTVKDRAFKVWLEVKAGYELNQTVFTAGNALGEGLVIRKGDLIGTTPEPLAGAWQFLRSSADVNSGNSGGPLLDAQGRVLGVVIARKDNISVSLPMAEARATGQARFFRRMTYRFSLFPESLDNVDHAFSIDLPKAYGELKALAEAKAQEQYARSMDELFEKNRAEIFPSGSTSLEVLYDIPTSNKPQLVFKDTNNKIWSYSGIEYKRFDLPKDGRIFTATADGTVMIHLDLPKDVPQAALLSEPKGLMDLFLQGLRFNRTLGGEDVRVTSFGAPLRSLPHVDRLGRPWTFHIWSLPHQDQYVIVPTAAVPGGFVMLLRQVETASLDPWLYDLRKILDFTVVPYVGSLKDWKAFLELPGGVPPAFQGMMVAFEPGREVSISTRWLQVKAGQKDLEIDSETILGVYLGFQPGDGGQSLDLRRLILEEAEDNNYFTVLKHFRPDERLPEGYQKGWRDLVRRRHPYTAEPYSDEGSTVVATVLPVRKAGAPPEVAGNLYTLYLNRSGSVEARPMKDRLNRLAAGILTAPSGGAGAPAAAGR